MHKENRIDFMIPGDTLVEKGFKFPLFGFEASPGDMIVENINNALGSTFLGMHRIEHLPGYIPFKGLMAKWYKVLGVKTNKEYLVTITDEGILVETGGEIEDFGISFKMIGEQVQRTVIHYRDFSVRQNTISEFLRRFLD